MKLADLIASSLIRMRWRRGGGGDGGGDGGGGGRETETRDKRIHDARNNPASISSKPYKNKQKEEEVGGGGGEEEEVALIREISGKKIPEKE